MVYLSGLSINPHPTPSFIIKIVVQFSTPLNKLWQCAMFFKKWFWNLWGLMKSSGGLNTECYVLAHPQLVPSSVTLECCPGTRKYQAPAPENTCHSYEGLHWYYSLFLPPCTSGKMNCSTGLYHSLFTCTPQLGGLKRAMKRASYKLGEEDKKKYFMLYHCICNKFSNTLHLGQLNPQRP